tara:strand:+ start:3155 stop:3739 length:585 start_codon:yes stop_codon:yes gene_type:complete
MSHNYERVGLLDSIFHYRNVLPTVDHQRLLGLIRGFDWPEVSNPPANTYYNLHGLRAQVEIEPRHGEIFNLIHKAHMKMMPNIYRDIGDNLPAAIYDKYSGYWLCKYPEGGYLSPHADVDADAGSVTTSYAINGDYEGGNIRFWENYNIISGENSAHVYPSNHLFKHEITPVTQGERYSVITWFSYQKGKQWLT